MCAVIVCVCVFACGCQKPGRVPIIFVGGLLLLEMALDVKLPARESEW